MVEGSIEHLQLLWSAFRVQFAQFAVPDPGGFPADFVESLPLCPQVLEGPFHGSGTEGHLHRQFIGAAPFEVEPAGDAPPGHFRKVPAHGQFTPEAVVCGGHRLLVAIVLHRTGESDGEIGIVLPCPALGEPVACEQAVPHHPHARPEGLALVAVDAVGKIQDEVTVAGDGISIAVGGRARSGGDFRADAVIGQGDGVVSGRCCLRIVAVAAPVALFGPVRRARVQMQGADGGHKQHVAQVGMSRAAEVRVGKAHDGGVVPAVSRAEGIHLRLILPRHVVRDRVGVGANLHAAERHAGAGEGVPHTRRSDEGVYIAGRLGRRRHHRQESQTHGEGNEMLLLHIAKFTIIRRLSNIRRGIFRAPGEV